MTFFMPMKAPPTTTHQMKQIRVVNGKPIFYEPTAVKEARAQLMAALAPNRPAEPLDGAISLYTLWLFPRGNHENGEWRTTKPDTDNLQKLLKDCMTALGFWKDDAQVARELVEKRWSDAPAGIYMEVAEIDTRSDKKAFGERRVNA